MITYNTYKLNELLFQINYINSLLWKMLVIFKYYTIELSLKNKPNNVSQVQHVLFNNKMH